MIRLLLYLNLALISAVVPAQVVINEIMADNSLSFEDEDGDYPDWIELYNLGPQSVDLSGWHLSDDLEEPLKWSIGTATIGPGDFLLVFASGKDRNGPGELHVDFRINTDGEHILLSDDMGQLIDLYEPVELEDDLSYGNEVDGQSGSRVRFLLSSPLASNSEGIVLPTDPITIGFSHIGGFYPSSIELSMETLEGTRIHYTTDGSEPTGEDPMHLSPITLADRNGDPDVISKIETGLNWEEPGLPGEKAHVLKAAAFIDGRKVSKTFTETYFISERQDLRYKDFSVISISLPADSLFSFERGIYVPGINLFEPGDRSTGNYFMEGPDWERQAHFEYFDTAHEKQLGQDIGLRIHGKSTRKEPQKTLRVYAREEYGEDYLDYPLFPDKDIDRFKRILLRSPFSDFGNTMFRDVLSTELIAELDIDRQAAQTCIVFVNGEYWGIHALRERIDNHYIASNHDISRDSLDLLTLNAIVEEGNALSYNQLLDYISTNDLSDPIHYDYVAERIDIVSYMDYYISQLYLANFDWPYINIRYWNGYREDSKWRWIFYDCDRCMLDSDYDHLFDFLYDENHLNEREEWTSLLFNRLMQNSEFKEEFTQRFLYQISTTFEPSRVIALIDSLEGLYSPKVSEHILRWGQPGSLVFWGQSVDEMREFALRRPSYMVDQLLDYLGPGFEIYPNPVSNSAGQVNLGITYTDEVEVSISIYDPLGRKVLTSRPKSLEGGSDSVLSLEGLEPGVYVVSLSYGPLLFSERLIIQ